MKNSSPFAHSPSNTSDIMRMVTLALLPGLLTESYYLGWGVIINALLCSIYALSAEACIAWLRKRSIVNQLSDNSALLTGLLIASAIPPLLPWWMSLIGVWFAIIIAKQLYGGLGFNPFNPAMVGYVLLLISFPVEMTAWLPSGEISAQHATLLESLQLTFTSSTSENLTLLDFRTLADGYTMATPLDESRTSFSLGLMSSEIIQKSNFSENLSAWFWINMGYAIGGIFLIFIKIIRWRIPVSMLASMLVTATALYLYDDQLFLTPWIQLTVGATMIGAFFIATDPVTASTTPKGRIIYAALIGFFIIIIRSFGGFPDAVAFSVLLLNIAVPTIDHYTQPRVYGSTLRDSHNE